MSQLTTKISIVVPIYNAATFLRQCLDSCLSQNYKALEIICINDASTDNTLSILNEYAGQNTNLKVFTNDENMGPAYCRNLGLEQSSGDYIWFIDSDDWIEPNALKKLDDLLSKAQADVIGFKAQTYNNKTSKIKIDNFRGLSIVPERFFYTDFNFKQGKDFLFLLPLELWSRVFKKEFLQKNQIRFDTEMWGLDDGLFVTECFLKAQSIYYSKDTLYTYRTHNSQSIIGRLDKPDDRIYSVPILYAQKSDLLVKKYQIPENDRKDLILRNLHRILNMYSKLKSSQRLRFFNEFKSYLHSTSYMSLSFVKNNGSYSTLKDFESLSYQQYVFKNFIFQIYESPTLKRILFFNITLYKRQHSHNLITERYPFSLLKILTHQYEHQTETKYLLFGLPIYTNTQTS